MVSRYPSLTGLHILVVDDNGDARDILTMFFQHVGALVAAVPSTREALKVLQAAIPNVIVTDLAMPGGDGYAFIRRLRRLPPARGGHVPVIAITGYATLHDRARALNAGFQAFFAKPVDLRELAAAVAELTRPSAATDLEQERRQAR